MCSPIRPIDFKTERLGEVFFCYYFKHSKKDRFYEKEIDEALVKVIKNGNINPKFKGQFNIVKYPLRESCVELDDMISGACNYMTIEPVGMPPDDAYKFRFSDRYLHHILRDSGSPEVEDLVLKVIEEMNKPVSV